MLPPDLVRLAALHRLRQQQLAGAALRQARRFWTAVAAGDPVGSWATVAPRFTATVTAYQAEAARGADSYVAAAVALSGVTPDPAGQVATRSLAGVASDGRDLATLLSYPAFQASAFLAGGMDATVALAAGGRHLARIVATQVQDAARVATGLAVTNDRRVRGWVRVVTPPACARCVILAGKEYRYNRGFQRHPHCDCVHMPAAEVLEPQSPRELFGAMSPAQLRRAGWVDADVRAIQDGADISQVTNARRSLSSMSVAGRTVQTTQVGTTRRSLAGTRLGVARGARAVRLTPEAIYQEADRLGWSRDETIRQLRRFGYIL